ncbi:hypothetical protein H4V95_000347 [Arthrobacter sp. CAN_C5]|nr:hypothetical protein [Arthrobacter sp. CAN_C5]
MALISPKSVERKYGVSTADLGRWRQTGEAQSITESRPVWFGTGRTI